MGRPIVKRRPPLIVEPLAEQVVALIKGQVEDDRLLWIGGYFRVKVLIGKIIPDEGSRETVRNRRKRFRRYLEHLLKETGWQKVVGTAAHTYRRKKTSLPTTEGGLGSPR